MTTKKFLFIARLASGIALVAAGAAHACNFAPKTPMEEVYCKIQDRGASQGLPNIFEFRKNPPQTQALLLKKTAARLGIDLPAQVTEEKPAETEHENIPVTNEIPKTAVISKPETAVISKPETASLNDGLSHCNLNRESIFCHSEKFTLQTNLQNRHLDPDALGDQNRLLLPPRNAPAYRDKSNHHYLSGIYPYYIEKMLMIGLADATMSFTKFAATYDDITLQGEDFSERFTKMYELLKSERMSNAVKARYNSNFPTSIAQCMQVSPLILVCDDIRQNWVYRKVD